MKDWNHLEDIDLADPGFGCLRKLDILVGIDIFVEAILYGRRIGPMGTPMASETHFGWVLAGSTVCHWRQFAQEVLGDRKRAHCQNLP